MSEAALALAASVAMHVTWNLLVRRQPQASYPLWWVLLGHLVLLAPAGWFCLWRDAAWQPALLGQCSCRPAATWSISSAYVRHTSTHRWRWCIRWCAVPRS